MTLSTRLWLSCYIKRDLLSCILVIKHFTILSEYIREPPLRLNRKISVTVAVAEHPTSTYRFDTDNIDNGLPFFRLNSGCSSEVGTYLGTYVCTVLK